MLFDTLVRFLARKSVRTILTPRLVLPDNEAERWFSWHLEPSLLIDWRDWWHGVYWDAREGSGYNDDRVLELTVYRTLLPCLVLRLHWWKQIR